MADPIATLIVKIAADISGLNTSMNKAVTVTQQSADRIKTAANTARGALAAIGVGLSVQGLFDLADAARKVNAQVNLATSGANEARSAFDDVFRIASANQAPVESVAKLFQRLSLSLQAYGGDAETALFLTEALSKSLFVNSSTAKEAESAMLQFGQAAGRFKLSGEEFTAVAEGAPTFLRAIAAGMNELNRGKNSIVYTTGNLQVLARTMEGLRFDVILKALRIGMKQIEEQAAQMPVTIGGAFTILRNNVIKEMDRIEKETTFGKSISDSILVVANSVRILTGVVTAGIKILLLYVGVFKVLPAVISSVGVASGVLLLSLNKLSAFIAGARVQKSIWVAMNAGADGFIASVRNSIKHIGLLRLAFSGLAAFIAGWDIGTALKEQFLKVELAGIALAQGLTKVGIRIRFAFDWEEMGKQLEQVDREFSALADSAIEARLPNQAKKQIADLKGPASATKEKGGSAKDRGPQLLLDQQLKALQNSLDEERESLRDHQRFLELYYNENEITIGDYYRTRQSIIDEALNKELAIIAEQIRLQDVFLGKATARTALERTFFNKADADDRIAAETKIAELIDNRRKLEVQAGRDAVFALNEQRYAMKRLREEMEDIAIEVKRTQNLTPGATAAEEFDARNRQLLQRLFAARLSSDPQERAMGEEGARNLDFLRRQYVETTKLEEADRQLALAMGQLNNAYRRISIARDSGYITEIESLAKIGALNAAVIPKLEQELALRRKIAETLAGPARDAALARIQDLQIQLEELKAAVDPLADKFRGLFVDAIGNSISELVSGSKSLKDVFKDLERQIVSSITRIAAQNVAESLFKKDGFLGGVPGFMSKIFGGQGGTGGVLSDLFGGKGTAAAAGLGSLTATSTTAATSVGLLAASAQTAAYSLQQLSFSNTAMGFGAENFSGLGFGSGFGFGMQDLGLFFADGGRPPVGRVSVVGERGPELFVPDSPGTIIPNNMMLKDVGARNQMLNTFNMTINPPPGMSRATQDQLSSDVARKVRRAMDRVM